MSKRRFAPIIIIIIIGIGLVVFQDLKVQNTQVTTTSNKALLTTIPIQIDSTFFSCR